MNCDAFQNLMPRQAEDDLPEPQRHALSDHLRTCPACREAFEQFSTLYDRLLRDGRTYSQPSLTSKVMDEIRKRKTVDIENPLWRFFMTHKLTAFSVCAAACVALAATLPYLFAHPVESPGSAESSTLTAAGPANLHLPVPADGIGAARTMAQRIAGADVIARASVHQVGEARPDTGEGDVVFKVIRILHGKLPANAELICVSLPLPLRNQDAIVAEQIIFLGQCRVENGQIYARYLGANYARLDETEKEITAIAAALNVPPKSGK